MKWYAEYVEVGVFTLVPETEYKPNPNDWKHDEDWMRGLQEFPNLRAAKKWIRDGIKCDMDTCRCALTDLKGYK